MSRWLLFEESARPAGRTKAWTVRSKSSGSTLGEVRWFGRWRQYAFFPHPGTVWNPDCLRDVAEFAAGRTREHGTARKVWAAIADGAARAAAAAVSGGPGRRRGER